MPTRYGACIAAVAAVWSANAAGLISDARPVSVDDVVEMQRIQATPQQDAETAYFSPDGTRFVSVLWRGDLDRNVNVYSLVLFDLRQSRPTHRTVLTAEFTSDKLRLNQHASAISQVTFADNRTVVFLGSLQGEEPQVYAVDVDTGAVRPLTRHATAVRSYGLSPTGQVRVFSAMAQPDTAACRALYGSGVSLFDRRLENEKTVSWLSREPGRSTELFDLSHALDVVSGRRCEAYGFAFQPVREYFLVPEGGGPPRPLLDNADGHMATRIPDGSMFIPPNLVVSPTGAHAILFPSREVDAVHARRYRLFGSRRGTPLNAFSIAVIDLETRRSRPLSAAPADGYSQGRILWARDGASVVTRSLIPLDADTSEENERRAQLPPQLVEIDVRTGRVAPIDSPANAQPLGFDNAGRLLLREGNRLLTMRKAGEGWSDPSLVADLGRAGFNRRYRVSTNGTVVIGVRDALSTAPEIAAYEPASHAVTVLTDLNPTLRERALGTVEKIFWKGTYDSESFGYLIKPVGYIEARRYPLVILLKDEPADAFDDSFLIDGQRQLSGHAAQTLAGAGFVVLFTPPPPSFRAVSGTPEEGVRMVAHIESGIDYLDQRGLIDRARMAIGGWSRAGFHTDYVLMHSRYPFKAGIQIDGGRYEWFMDLICGSATRTDHACDRNLERLGAARLSQLHGTVPGAISEMSFLSRLRALGKAVDFYFYPDEPHTVQTPQRRRHSLTLNVDWYRFWLQDFEDPDPDKAVQYERWRRLREATGPSR